MEKNSMKMFEKKREAKRLLSDMKNASTKFSDALKNDNLELGIGFDLIDEEKILVITLLDLSRDETLIPTNLIDTSAYALDELGLEILRQISILHELSKIINNESLNEMSSYDEAVIYTNCMVNACIEVFDLR